MKKKITKIILVTLLALGLATGLFFFVRYQIRLFNTIKYLAERAILLENFIVVSFPDQTTQFNETLKAK